MLKNFAEVYILQSSNNIIFKLLTAQSTQNVYKIKIYEKKVGSTIFFHLFAIISSYDTSFPKTHTLYEVFIYPSPYRVPMTTKAFWFIELLMCQNDITYKRNFIALIVVDAHCNIFDMNQNI